MFVKFKKNKLRSIINIAIKKAGSERKLCKIVGFSKIALYYYKNELYNIPKDRLLKILNVINSSFEFHSSHIMEILPENWGQIKGGINCVKKKKSEGTFDFHILKLKKISSKRMKEWHRHMKVNFPKEYYIWQYERFKKVSRGYSCKLANGIFVRNNLEKEVGDFLLAKRIDFQYESYINIDGKVYFPDFKIGNKIVEVTGWKHPGNKKIFKLRKKFKDYNNAGFNTILFVPLPFRKFYKMFESFTLSDFEELNKVLYAPL